MLGTRLMHAWRTWRTKRKLLREVAPEAFLRLTGEVDSLSICAALTCPDGLDMQCLQKNVLKLRQEATSAALATLPLENRLALRQQLIHSRQQLIRGLQGAARPTRYMQ